MRALVFGGTGFLGRNICEHLKKLDMEVHAVGRDFVLPQFFVPYDFIFFLAGEVRKQVDMYYTHVELLYKVLCRSLNINCVFVYVGSSSEYGRMDEPMTEDCPINPTNLYDATKGIGTLMCQGFAREFDRTILIVRPSSVFGKYERTDKLIPVIIKKIKNQEPVDIYPGVHDYVHIDDFVNGIFHILSHVEPDKLKGEIYNVSSGIQTSNLEIVNTIYDIMGEIPLISSHNEKFHAHDVDQWIVDSSKLESLGWKRKYDLYSGLQKTVPEILDEMSKNTFDKKCRLK